MIRRAAVALLLITALAACAGRTNVIYPLIDGVEFQVRSVKRDDNRYYIAGSRAERGARGIIDPVGEADLIRRAIRDAAMVLCEPLTPVVLMDVVQPLVIAIETEIACVETETEVPTS